MEQRRYEICGVSIFLPWKSKWIASAERRVDHVESRSVEFRRGKRFADSVPGFSHRGVSWNPYLFSTTHPGATRVFTPFRSYVSVLRVNSEWCVELETQDPTSRQTERIARSSEIRKRQCPSDNWRASSNASRKYLVAFALFRLSLPRDNSIAANIVTRYKSYSGLLNSL
jgi:hypothetical protein